MTEMLRELLHEGNHTLVVAQSEIRSFSRRGITDLYELLHGSPEFLHGASVADKVVGKGAAALMIVGGVAELYADVVSEDALALLRKSPVSVTFGQCVPHIQNRTGTGMCPVEALCQKCTTAAECLPLIESFYQSHTTN